MLTLALLTSKNQRLEIVNDFASPQRDSCLKQCDKVCLLSEETLASVSTDGPIVLPSRSSSTGGGFVCWSTDSAELIAQLPPERYTFGVYSSNVEGPLDEGLRLGSDFSLAHAAPWATLLGMDRVFLASASLDPQGWWYFLLHAEQNAVVQLLRSSTKGYLMGVAITDLLAGTVARLVRSAGCDDQETDLFISDGDFPMFSKALVTF